MSTTPSIIKVPVIYAGARPGLSESGLNTLKATLMGESSKDTSPQDIARAITFLLSQYDSARGSGGAGGFLTEIRLPSGSILLLGDASTLARATSCIDIINGDR